MRLIDADELIVIEYGGIKFVPKEFIDDAPTIDAVQVRHGKWIIEDNPRNEWYRVTCSECGENVTSTAPCIGFLPNAKVAWDYCPYCGAQMDEEEP